MIRSRTFSRALRQLHAVLGFDWFVWLSVSFNLLAICHSDEFCFTSFNCNLIFTHAKGDLITAYQRNGSGYSRPTRNSNNQPGLSILVQKYRRRGRGLGPFARLNHVRLGRFDSIRVLFTWNRKVVHLVVVNDARASWSILWAEAERNKKN